jgi:chemotaxis protein MotB
LTILVFGVSLLVMGCEDPKVKIAQLEDQLAKANEDLSSTQDELARALADQRKAQNEAQLLRQQNADLQAKLAQKPEMPEGWDSVPGGAMTSIPGSILFDSGKAKLRSGGVQTLNTVAATIKERFPGKDIYVFGHTDTQPIRKSGWKDNYELSCQRALEVVRYLSKSGLNARQLVACGWGEHRPTASNSTAADRQKNRRVEIFAVDQMMASKEE